MQGDDKAKATVDAMMSGLLKDVSKYSLEKGVASSVLANRKDLVRQVGGERVNGAPLHQPSYWCTSGFQASVEESYKTVTVDNERIASHVKLLPATQHH